MKCQIRELGVMSETADCVGLSECGSSRCLMCSWWISNSELKGKLRRLDGFVEMVDDSVVVVNSDRAKNLLERLRGKKK